MPLHQNPFTTLYKSWCHQGAPYTYTYMLLHKLLFQIHFIRNPQLAAVSQSSIIIECPIRFITKTFFNMFWTHTTSFWAWRIRATKDDSIVKVLSEQKFKWTINQHWIMTILNRYHKEHRILLTKDLVLLLWLSTYATIFALLGWYWNTKS